MEATLATPSAPEDVEELRQRVLRMQRAIASYFVHKGELVELMTVCMLAQEPLLIVGRPGTAKSDLVIKFTQAMGLTGDAYFEYMLTKFTEPGEIIGPVDIQALKEGRYLRRVDGKLPMAKVVFLDEIFKSNSAILNTLLTVINERKYYQEGRPCPVEMRMLYAATNEIPDFSELDALKDRFTLKVESRSVRDAAFDELLEHGLRNELFKVTNQRPWTGLCALSDFEQLKAYLDRTMLAATQADEPGEDRRRYFPDDVYALFKRILRTLEREDQIEVSDRKIIKLYRLLRVRAFLYHGGVVRRDDLVLLRHIGQRQQDLSVVREKVDALLGLDYVA